MPPVTLTDERRALAATHWAAGLVHAVARTMLRRVRGEPLDELVSWGAVGLVEAARTWPGTGSFESYAATAIRVAILKGMGDLSPWGRHRLHAARKAGRTLPLVLGVVPERAADSHDDLAAVETAELAGVALAALPAGLRALVEAHYLGAVPVADLAAARGERHNTTYHRLRRALPRMRRRLARSA